MPSDALKAIARTHAAKIVSGEVSPSDGARAIWTDVFYHLEPGDHFADGFVFWGYEIDTAETDARRWFCEAAVLNLARRLVQEENGHSAGPFAARGSRSTTSPPSNGWSRGAWSSPVSRSS